MKIDDYDALERRIENLEKEVFKTSGGKPPVGALKPVPDEVKSQAFVLLRNEKCKPEWQKFLTDIQGYKTMSEKQWKFWAVINKECTGSWPARWETVPATHTAAATPVYSQDNLDAF